MDLDLDNIPFVYCGPSPCLGWDTRTPHFQTFGGKLYIMSKFNLWDFQYQGFEEYKDVDSIKMVRSDPR